MKWFKHMTAASDDEGLVELESKFGLEGYARWFKLLEAVGKQMDETGKCSAAYPWSKWQEILKGKRKVLERFFLETGNILGTKAKQTGNILEIEIPNLLKIRDNHTRNLQAAGKQEVDVDKDKKKSGADAPTVWDLGVGMGIDRSVIGRQIKSAGEDKVAETLAHMAVKRPADPTQYFIAATTKRKRRTAV